MNTNNNISTSNMLTGYMKLIEANLENPILSRKLSAHSIPFEFWAGVDFTLDLPFNMTSAVLKLPFTFFRVILPKDSILGQICNVIHYNLPGVTDVVKTAAKAAFCFINIIFSPLLGIISPTANLKLHIATGIVQEFPVRDIITNKREEQPVLPKKGFEAIVGMKKIKDQFQEAVINPLKNPEKFKKYKLNVPNGVLLYGPPGCGKTYLVEHLAEEMGWQYRELSASTYGSKWMHESSQNLRNIFRKAAEKPTVLFIDEVETIIPKRSNLTSEHGSESAKKEEIGTFLIELQSAAEKNILVCMATNRPEEVDEAALRSGRIDIKIRVDYPDHESRVNLFQFYMDGRPADDNIDYNKLANLTEGFCCSDFKALVDRAATTACNQDIPISEKLLEGAISDQKEQDDQATDYKQSDRISRKNQQPLSYFS